MWILISWLLPKPADLVLHCVQEKSVDQDPYCLQELIYIRFHTVFERIICLSTERYKIIFFIRTSKIFYGPEHFGFLLALGQVENFTISTPLPNRQKSACVTNFHGSSEILSSLSTSSIQATEKNLGFFNEISLYHFLIYDVYCVCFTAFKLVIVLAWFL